MTLPAQITRSLLMVRPASFGPNPETAPSNAFQQPSGLPAPDLQMAAEKEFDGLVQVLERAGAEPRVVQDAAQPARPDAIFPNNWVSFHEDGTVILYPMQARNRRTERRLEILEKLAGEGLIRLDRLIDLSPLEHRGLFLEGTGSLVMDRRNGLAYAALSPRTHAAAITEFTRRTGMPVLAFHASDDMGRPLYHTNVMLSVGGNFSVVCPEAISDAGQRRSVLGSLAAGGRGIIEISRVQMLDFCANLLEVGVGGGASAIVLSARAHQSLHPDQRERLLSCGAFAIAPIPTVENVGGGSVRCMIAEIFSPGTA